MSTFHCKKLCESSCCSSFRIALIADGKRSQFATASCDCFECSACDLITDPKKLAKLMMKALRARGLDVESWSPEYPPYDPSIAIRLKDGSFRRIMSMKQARTDLLMVMATPADETSFDVVKQIIGAG